MVPLWQKKSVWQVTTIIQPALCHLVTSHFQEIACNWTPKDQIRWPIFLMLLCMIVLTEKTLKFPQPIIFWILVFSCHKMTLITKITWMPQVPVTPYLQIAMSVYLRSNPVVGNVKLHNYAISGAGVSIIFKNRVFYKAWFKGFEFFIVWPFAVFHKCR